MMVCGDDHSDITIYHDLSMVQIFELPRNPGGLCFVRVSCVPLHWEIWCKTVREFVVLLRSIKQDKHVNIQLILNVIKIILN